MLLSTFHCPVIIEHNGIIIFGGKADICRNSTIRCSGRLSIGNNAYINCNSFVSCNYFVNIGDDFLGGFNLHIQDCDSHKIFYENREKTNHDSIIIGNHVWCGANVDILKGAAIANGSILSFRSLDNMK